MKTAAAPPDTRTGHARSGAPRRLRASKSTEARGRSTTITQSRTGLAHLGGLPRRRLTRIKVYLAAREERTRAAAPPALHHWKPVRVVRVHVGRRSGARPRQLRPTAARPPVSQLHPKPYGSCAFRRASAAARDKDQGVSRRARGAHARGRAPATPPPPKSRTGHVCRRAPTTPPPSPTPTKPVRDKRAQKASEK